MGLQTAPAPAQTKAPAQAPTTTKPVAGTSSKASAYIGAAANASANAALFRDADKCQCQCSAISRCQAPVTTKPAAWTSLLAANLSSGAAANGSANAALFRDAGDEARMARRRLCKINSRARKGPSMVPAPVVAAAAPAQAPNLTEGLPDPTSVDRQKLQHARSPLDRLQADTAILAQQNQVRKQMLAQYGAQQKAQHAAQVHVPASYAMEVDMCAGVPYVQAELREESQLLTEASDLRVDTLQQAAQTRQSSQSEEFSGLLQRMTSQVLRAHEMKMATAESTAHCSTGGNAAELAEPASPRKRKAACTASNQPATKRCCCEASNQVIDQLMSHVDELDQQLRDAQLEIDRLRAGFKQDARVA